jgi:arylsulfatase A-like enzyme
MLHKPLGVSEEFKGLSQWGEYGDAIQELDHHTGRLVDRLDELGLAKNTIVIYASDNGRGPGRNTQQPIKGTKLSTYEGGIRVPAIAWGPGVGIRAGHECAAVVHAMDWYPTLATLAGIKVPSGPILDGRDLSSLLTGKTDKIPLPSAGCLNSSLPLRRPWNPSAEWATLVERVEYQNAFFYHGSHGALAAVRSGPWKLFLNPKPTLYNLANDPGEKPVFNGQIIRKLRGMAVIFQEEMRRDARPAGEVSLGKTQKK